MIVLVEAKALERDGAFTYMLRSLLSEGVASGMKLPAAVSRSSSRSRPYGLITTTTLPMLEPQLETRLLSVYSDASEDQTRRILRETARRSNGESSSGTGVPRGTGSSSSWAMGATMWSYRSPPTLAEAIGDRLCRCVVASPPTWA